MAFKSAGQNTGYGWILTPVYGDRKKLMATMVDVTGGFHVISPEKEVSLFGDGDDVYFMYGELNVTLGRLLEYDLDTQREAMFKATKKASLDKLSEVARFISERTSGLI